MGTPFGTAGVSIGEVVGNYLTDTRGSRPVSTSGTPSGASFSSPYDSSCDSPLLYTNLKYVYH